MSKFRRRNLALLVPAENAIPMPRDEVVQTISNRPWNDAHHEGEPPRPSELRGHEQNGIRLCEHTGVGPSILRDHIERRQLTRIAPVLADDGPTGRALKRRKAEPAGRVVRQHEAHNPAAEPAYAVVQEKMCPRLRLPSMHRYY